MFPLNRMSRSYPLRLITLLICSLTISICGQLVQADDATAKTNYVYLNKGELVSGWELSVGDPGKWYTPISDRTGKSASNKVSISPTDFRAHNDAIQLVWAPRKPISAYVSIAGAPLDLSSVEQSAGLVLDMKVDVAPDKDVALGMSCGDPCKGELHIGKLLKNLKAGEWMSLPIPLSCLVKQGVDIKKVTAPLLITTEGKLTLSITNVRIEKLHDDEKVCP